MLPLKQNALSKKSYFSYSFYASFFLYSLLLAVSLLVNPIFKWEQKSRLFTQLGILIHFHSCPSHTAHRNGRSGPSSCASALLCRHRQQGRAAGLGSDPQDTSESPGIAAWQFLDKADNCF